MQSGGTLLSPPSHLAWKRRSSLSTGGLWGLASSRCCPLGSVPVVPFPLPPLAAQKHWEPKAMLCSAALRGSRMRFVLMALERWGWCWNKKKKPKTSRFFFCLQEKERKKINLFFWFFFLDKKQNYCKMCSDELVPSVLVKPMRNWASPFFSPLITSQ